MISPTFVIPLNREDLLSVDNPSQYFVQELVSGTQIPRRLADCNAALSDDGFLFILTYFDPLFSALHQARDIETRYILQAHTIILKGLSGMNQSLLNMMEDMASHMQEKLLNAAKMYIFLLFEALRSLEERFNSKTNKELAVDVKSRKKAIKNFVDFDWDEKRHISLVKLHEFIQLPLAKLWDPPVADEDFVNLVANCCYKTLEDSQVTQARLSYLKHTVFDILGTLIQKYGHGLSCTVKMVQLMKLYEHLPEALAQAAVKFVREYQSRNFIREVIREIHQSETEFENSAPKACSHFLIEISRLDSEVILPSISMLLPELKSDSPYMMRNCVLGVLGEVVSGCLAKEHLSDDLKEKRDIFLEHLQDHLIDTNATVRSKVLKVWQRLCEEKAIPLARMSQLLESVVSRLEDASWSVTRSAVQLYHSLLQSNPFDHKLEIEKLKEELGQEEDLLVLLEKESSSKIPPPRSKQWDEISPNVIHVLEEALRDKEAEEDLPEEARGKDMSDNILLIFRYLESGMYLEAFHVLRYTDKQSDRSKHRSMKELGWQIDYFHDLLRKIYVEFDEIAKDRRREKDEPQLSPEQRELKEKLLKQCTLVQFLKGSITFAEQLETATNIINILLFSAQPTIILDALEFLTAAYQFGLKGALTGVQNMLLLVWSSENSVKTGVATAYRQLYIKTASNVAGRLRADEIVRNLCHLLKTLDDDQQCALEVLVREWVQNGDMDKDCFQILWQRFSLKLPDTSEEDSRSALILLAMVGGADPSILKTNIPVLMSVGFGERGCKDCRLVKETCRALLKLVSEPQSVTSNEEPFRLARDHEIFQSLCSLCTKGYNSFDDKYYIQMCYEAIEVIYQLSEHPDVTCSTLLNEVVELTKKASVDSGEAFDELLSTSSNNETLLQSKAMNSSFKISQELLERFVFFIGHIAFRQWIHLDKAVFRELKRRNRIREIEAEKKRDSQKNKSNKDKRKSQANLNSSILSRASETPRLKKDKEDAADTELGEINADDAEADYINHVCETEVLTGDSILNSLSAVVVTVCTNPQKYTESQLQSTASLSLTKLMLVSSAFCETNLPLVFTMMEKSSEPQLRSNLVYAIGDLANRFPNLIEPWTKHLYYRLQDKSPQVRLATIVVLKHLITNEMVKVRGQISDMALCIVDAEERISVMASEFFRDLSKKGNTLYNVMPDIISRLSNPTMNVKEDHFHVIMEFLLPLISKDRQMESLVDKLCQRFRASATERQWSDIAFCLSLLQYSDRSLRRLTENFQCYFDKLTSDKVYEAFESIIAQALKTNKPERKLLVEELQAKIDETMKRGLVGDDAERNVEDAENSNVDVEDRPQKENIRHNRKDKKRETLEKRRRGRRRVYSSDEDDEKDTSDNETPVPQSKGRKRRR